MNCQFCQSFFPKRAMFTMREHTYESDCQYCFVLADR